MSNNDMKDLISQFKSSIFKFYQNKEKEEIDPIILLDCNLSRFLIARDLDIDKALIMFINVNTWRKNIPITDINISEIKKIKKLFPSYWLTLDKYGHPVYIECPGIINMKKLMKITTIELMTNIYIQNSEYMFTHLYESLSNKSKLNITQTLSIIDLKGCSFRSLSKEVYVYIKNIINIGNTYYPETIYKMFIINAPFVFNTMWSLIKPLIPIKTREKIHILKTGQENILYEFIDKDKLPKNLDFTNIDNSNNIYEKNYLDWLER
jgi:hypothetical protein